MAKTINKSPLGERHYTQLKQLQRSIQGTLEFLSKCKKCKLDVDEELQATKDQLEVIRLMLLEFFANQPA